MDLSTALGKFEQHLDESLSSECTDAQRQALKLYQLVVYIWETVQKIDSPFQREKVRLWFLDRLKIKFKNLSTCPGEFDAGNMHSWEVFAKSYYSYMSKLTNMSEVIYYIDSNCRVSSISKSFMSLLQDYYLQQALGTPGSLMLAYREVCEHFINGNKDCKDYLLLVHNVMNEYLMRSIDSPRVRSNVNTKEFFSMGAICMRKWVSSTRKKGFIESWKVYQNTLELLKILGQKKLSESGLKMIYNGDGKSFMESLNNLVLDADLLNVICKADNQNSTEWLKYLSHFFKSSRSIKLDQYDFDKLLTSILLNDFFSANSYSQITGDCIIIKEMRDEFKERIRNKKEFNIKLLNYMLFKFRKDYHQRSISQLVPCTADDILWINAMVSLIIHYIPDLSEFLRLYLRQGLFRQMVMFDSNFSTFLNEPECLERALLRELNKIIPSDMYFIRNLLSTSAGIPDKGLRLKETPPELNRFYISKELASELSLPLSDGMEPIWPTKSMECCWTHDSQNYQKQGKKLHGLFSIHVLSVSTPIILSSGKNLTLIGDLTMSSVLYLFNDSDSLTEGRILEELGNRSVKYVETTINKLRQHRILVRKKSNQLMINMRYEASPKVLSSGILKII